MKRFKLLMSSFIVLMAAVSCGSGSGSGSGSGYGSNLAETTQIPVIDFEKGAAQAHKIALSEVAKEIEYIPLQTIPEAHLADLKFADFREIDGKYIILTSQAGCCKVFDSNGNYVNSVGIEGRGPGELPAVYDMEISDNNTVLLSTPFKDKYVIYDINGNPISETVCSGNFNDKPGNAIMSVVPFTDDIFCVSLYHPKEKLNTLAIMDTSKNILATYYQEMVYENPTYTRAAFMSPYHMYKYGETMRVLNQSTDTVFSLSKDLKRTAAYILHFGKYKYELDEKTSKTSIKLSHSHHDIFMESDSFIFFRMTLPYDGSLTYKIDKNPFGYALYNKTKQELKAIAYNSEYEIFGLENDIDNGYPFWPIHVKNNKMYQLVDAYNFIEASKNSSSEQMKAIAATLTEESNPVLVVATLK